MRINKFRYLARIILQTETPLSVGSGERNMLTDHLIITDVNRLPYIPGPSLAGVLKQALASKIAMEEVNLIMGFQGRKNENGSDDGMGSRLILSHAQILGNVGLPVDGIAEINWEDPFFKFFQTLPVRQHVRISHQGAAEDRGKFDEQIVYKGTRFCFEVELVSDNNKNDEYAWELMLSIIQSPAFRIGSGTRKGFGELSVVDIISGVLDLSSEIHLESYLEKTSSLNDKFWKNLPIGFVKAKKTSSNDLPSYLKSVGSLVKTGNWTSYQLNLQPDDFFLFSSGLENADAKMIPVTERVIVWDNPFLPTFTNEQILIPATSVKGALAHRVAFHFNILEGNTAESIAAKAEENGISFLLMANQFAGANNPAVKSLFGCSAKGDEGQIGNVIFSDFIVQEEPAIKLLNHVAIDRFTGGAKDGALFTEQVIFGKGSTYNLIISANLNELDSNVRKAFELSLIDIALGLLPLGGGTMRGHGCFTGKIFKDKEELKNAN